MLDQQTQVSDQTTPESGRPSDLPTDRTIIRVKKSRENPYVQVHKGLLNDKRLRLAHKGLLCYLLSKPDDWVFYAQEVSRHLKENRDTIGRLLADLVELGYIVRERAQHGYNYIVFESPELQAEPAGKTSVRENHARDFHDRENRALLNNDPPTEIEVGRERPALPPAPSVKDPKRDTGEHITPASEPPTVLRVLVNEVQRSFLCPLNFDERARFDSDVDAIGAELEDDEADRLLRDFVAFMHGKYPDDTYRGKSVFRLNFADRWTADFLNFARRWKPAAVTEKHCPQCGTRYFGNVCPCCYWTEGGPVDPDWLTGGSPEHCSNPDERFAELKARLEAKSHSQTGIPAVVV